MIMFVEIGWYGLRPLARLILSGVMERHPDLRFAFTETGNSLVPEQLKQLDLFHRMARDAKEGSVQSFFGTYVRESVPLRPSEYWARQCFLGASFLSPADCEHRHRLGVDRVMWGADYPHTEGTHPHTAESLCLTFAGVDRAETAQILGLNAATAYGFDVDQLRPIADRIGPFAAELERGIDPDEIPMSEHDRDAPDLAIGAFTAHGPWTVDPAVMAWRVGIDGRRATNRARVPELVRPRRLPPARALLVVGALGRAAIPWLARNWRRRDEPEALAALAPRLRPAFERLGATYIKLGQLIASADGMLPPALVEEFKHCRDRVPPEPFAHVRAVLEAELGRPVDAIFAHLDPEPLAAASIAQVHVGRLHDGQEVVVKVQRPHVEAVVARDLATLAWLAPIVEKRNPQASLANLPAYVELFAETIVEELDFRLEAQNMLDIAAVLATTDQRTVVVPRPHPELVTERVLVMERLRGFHIDDEQAMLDAGIDPSPIFRTLMISIIEGALVHGVFHGDLHGGNMVVTADGKPALFDFGITGRLAQPARLALLGLLTAGQTGDIPTQLACFRDLGGFPPDADLDKIAVELDLEALPSRTRPTCRPRSSPSRCATSPRRWSPTADGSRRTSSCSSKR
jgi:ubiquinone biosynthesis protein